MPTKKKESKKKKPAEPKSAPKSSRYFSGVGRRKTSVARVRIVESKEKSVPFLVNGKEIKLYFSLPNLQETAASPLGVAGGAVGFSVSVKASGGGIRGQAEAIRLGLSRALVSFSEEFKKPLRALGYLTRDDRIVERKKPGLKKARRAPQWKKR